MSVTQETVGVRHVDPRGTFARTGHIAAVLAMFIVVLLGFWPFYAGLFRGGTGAHWVLYLHAAVFSGWMALLLTQVVLVFMRRTSTHRRLGQFGVYYGALVLLMGLVVTFAAPALSVAEGRSSLDDAAGFLILPLGDMLLFGTFFGAGIAYRRKPEIHKRWMVLASIALIYPGAARFAAPYGLPAIIAVWLLPLGVLVAHEAVTRGRVERIYLAGVAILLLALARLSLMETEGWLVVGRRLLMPFIPEG